MEILNAPWVFYPCVGLCYVPPTKTLTSSSLALYCPRGTAVKHYFAGAASVVQLFHIFRFSLACYGETLLLVSSSFSIPSRSIFITVVTKPLTADHFFTVVIINSRWISGSGVDPSASFSFFQWSAGTRRIHVPHPWVLHTAGHCGASSCLNWWR